MPEQCQACYNQDKELFSSTSLQLRFKARVRKIPCLDVTKTPQLNVKKYIIANWKSQKNASQAAAWLQNFPKDQASKALLQQFELIVALPYPLLAVAQNTIEELQLPLQLAVQDISAFGPGAYTGEVCPENLSGFNIAYALLGHSERRRFLKESSQLVADKLKEAKRAGWRSILCVDRPYFQEQWQFLNTVDLEQSLLAYEPVAAIGSGQPESVETLSLVKKELRQIYPRLPLIYGGSVHAGNIADYLTICDGVLVGTASLEVKEFIDLLYHANLKTEP